MRVSFIAAAAALMILPLTASGAGTDFVQQGAKLVGNDAAGPAVQGYSVALSADGNTAIVGGESDDGGQGAAWVYVRSNGVWSQQGAKLVGTGGVGGGAQGSSVAISADGNTAVVGAPEDNGLVGATWVFVRSNGVWSQQGSRLVGTGSVGSPRQGSSVSVSADGNTAIVGGPGDEGLEGAAWVFERDNGVWSQQGEKLVGTGVALGFAQQGHSVAISGDGNTAVVGGIEDDAFKGAAWVFVRNAGVWTQQGAKLVGTGAGPEAGLGVSVAVSENGNTVVVGGSGDQEGVGAVWVFVRSNGVWSQQGDKLVGTGGVGAQDQGYSVAVSADGNTAIESGFVDDDFQGAAWVFVRDGGVWIQLGEKLVGGGAVGSPAQGFSAALSADGSTAIVGGDADDSQQGAAWVFFRTANVVVEGPPVPKTVFMAAIQPNPARESVRLRFGLHRDAVVSIGVYDLSGRLVRTLARSRYVAGEHALSWDLLDAEGAAVPGGVFFVRMSTKEGEVRTGRLVVVR